ncbi:MAG: sulfatase, partial [Planctomycetaceae bacterium]|nr:sulfatase [Planctomycetaceae bacterium]
MKAHSWIRHGCVVIVSFVVLLAATAARSETSQSAKNAPTNFVVIFCDDLGYGDIGPFGNPTIHTPALDRMAQEGQRWTSFYVGASVCTPSRAALLTGRLPIRNGMCSARRRVLFPDSGGGLPSAELTIAEVLKQAGPYATACVGKWHLGHLPEFLPTRQGFDSYYGVPYSNDMDRDTASPAGRKAFDDPQSEYWNVPLMRDDQVIERPADQNTLTRRYTEEAVAFISQHRDQPFFLYLAHSMPHVPLFRSSEFADTSRRGRFGDVIEEIDWSVGQILEAVRQHDIAQKTLVVFTSDNGPWLVYNQHGGSAGLLRGGKGGTFEGGMREPTLMWCPGFVPTGTVMDVATTMDLLPTFAELAGASVPQDRVLDGVSLVPLLTQTGKSSRDTVIYYRGTEV